MLLILAIVAIGAVRDGGIIKHAQDARTNYSEAQIKEEVQLELNDLKIESSLKETDEVAYLQSKLGPDAEITINGEGKGNFKITYKGYEITVENYGVSETQKTEQGGNNPEQGGEDKVTTSEESFEWASYEPGTEGYGTITGYIGTDTEVVIPIRCTEIGESAFEEASELTSITIPGNVISIGDNAFIGLSGLESVTIEDGVTNIGKSAFDFCIGLTNITIPGSVETIGKSAFENCEGLKTVIIEDGVTSIGNQAFQSTIELTSITIPDSVTSIGGNAFGACGLTSIIIPDSVTSIGANAFEYWNDTQTIYFEVAEEQGSWDPDWYAECSATVEYEYTAQ